MVDQNTLVNRIVTQYIDIDANKSKKNLDDVNKRLKDISKSTDITAALSTSLNKRGGTFDFNSSLNTLATASAAKMNAKQIAAEEKAKIALQERFNESIRQFEKLKRKSNVVEQLGSEYTKADIPRKKEIIKDINAETAAIRKQSKIGTFWSMNMLSFIFIGQQIQATMTRIATTTLNSFQTVASSSNVASQGLTAVGIGFEVIKISIGEAIATALLPYIDTIMSIAMSIAEWIQGHRELVASIVIGGIVLGFLMNIIAQTVIAANSLVNMFNILNTVILTIGGGSTAAGFAVILGWVLLLGAIVALVVLAWQNDLGGFQKFVKDTFGLLWNIIKDWFTTVLKVGGYLFKALGALMNGDISKAIDYLILAFAEALKYVIRLFLNLGAAIYNIFVWIIDTVENFFAGLISWLLKGIKDFVNWVASGLGALGGPLRDIANLIGQFQAAFEADKAHTSDYMNTETIAKAVNLTDDYIDKLLKVDDIEKKLGITTATNAAANTKDQTTANSSWQSILDAAGVGNPLTQPDVNTNVTINNNVSANGDKEILKVVQQENNKTIADMKAYVASAYKVGG